jgi:hypothetical protein
MIEDSISPEVKQHTRQLESHSELVRNLKLRGVFPPLLCRAQEKCYYAVLSNSLRTWKSACNCIFFLLHPANLAFFWSYKLIEWFPTLSKCKEHRKPHDGAILLTQNSSNFIPNENVNIVSPRTY